MKIVFIGLSLSSSWGNGHATTYRSLMRALAHRGHDCIFLECERPWYRSNQDLTDPDFCRLCFYTDLIELQQFAQEIRSSDLVIVGSFIGEGIAVGDYVLQEARGVTAFFDIDTPVTLKAVERGDCSYLHAMQMARYDLYLSFSGGPRLFELSRRFGVKRPRALYCSSELPLVESCPLYDLTYMGTYSADRQPGLDELLVSVAAALPERQFLIAGPQYPDTSSWPSNIKHLSHISPQDHQHFYASSRFTLNITRADMRRFGFSPSVRLFEAAAAGAPIISDSWEGIDSIFDPGREICLASGRDDVLACLDMTEPERMSLRKAARARFEQAHLPNKRACDLEAFVAEVNSVLRPEGASCCCP